MFRAAFPVCEKFTLMFSGPFKHHGANARRQTPYCNRNWHEVIYDTKYKNKNPVSTFAKTGFVFGKSGSDLLSHIERSPVKSAICLADGRPSSARGGFSTPPTFHFRLRSTPSDRSADRHRRGWAFSRRLIRLWRKLPSSEWMAPKKNPVSTDTETGLKTKGRVSDSPYTKSGGDLLSHTVARVVPSALKGLTAEFGMGSGVTPSL